MSRSSSVLVSIIVFGLALPAAAQAKFPGIGRPATPAEIAAWDIDVRPDFKGLPKGSGSVAKGEALWEAKCTSCHGSFGESNEVFAPLVGGTTAEDIRTGRVKALVTGDVARTTLMKVPTVSTLWDYINRAMPWNAPKSLSPDEVYAVLAYLLNLGDIVPAGFVLSSENIAEVQKRMPNRNGMQREHGLWDVKGRPDVANVACMKDCPVTAAVASALPDHAKGAHGNLSEQNRPVGPARGVDTSNGAPAPAAVAAASPSLALAQAKGCMACHGVDKRVVGPGYQEIAARYKGDAGALPKLVAKVKAGGAGVWGAIPMPPSSGLSDDEAASLVRWVLSGAP
jgi:S-disulfanyl-L-cysteine oxidoreductase SoxD